MSGGESSKRGSTIGTPVKALKRDVRGLLSLQQESPSQSDVMWSSLDSPNKPSRTVGGKSKTLKSSNQLTPKNHAIRKKYYSSPVLVARVPDENDEELRKQKNLENQRILEEFHRQFSNENYVPRNLLDNLSDNLEDSIIAPDAQLNPSTSDAVKKESDKLADLNMTDQEDFDILAEIEEEARQRLVEKESQKPASVTSFKPKLPVPKPDLFKASSIKDLKSAPTIPNINKQSSKNDYFDSDDDDIILSIPLEQLSSGNSKPPTLSNKIEQPAKSNNFSHTSVIPTRRENINVSSDKNRIQNQNDLKPLIQSKSVAENVTTEPSAKRRCTAEEIAEKRRQAMQRREAHLQKMRATQKSKN